MTIGETIRRLRKEKGLTQDALADALEISRQAVAKWESGKSAPATENLLKLAALLEVPLEELAGPKEQPSCALEEYARMQLEQERKKQAAKAALRTELQRAAAIAAGYLAVYLACLTAFYLAGAKSCIWGWMQSCHILAVTCLVHLAFRLLGRRRAGGALLAGTLAAIPLANAAGEADAGAGKPRAPGLAADRFPADYAFGSSAYKGYAVYWSSGYNDGYDARAASPESAGG